MFQFVLGAAGGAPATAKSMIALQDMLPANAFWAAFGIGRHAFPMVVQASLLGGNVRVGLEDNLYVRRGQLGTNADLVAKAAHILDELAFTPMTATEVRAALDLKLQ